MGVRVQPMSDSSTRLCGPFVGGEPVAASDGKTRKLVNPATEAVVGTVDGGGAGDVDEAVRDSRRAAGEWTALAPPERGRILQDVAAAIREQQESLAELEAADAGKPISDAESEVESLARYFEYYAGITDKIGGETVPAGDAYATVVKPAGETPRTAVEAARIAVEAGLPPGVINVVPGSGTDAGSALAGHEGIDCVSFTGSVPTGVAVGRAAIGNVNPVHLELGGNGPNVVFPDADFENAVDNALAAVFSNAGQVCSAGPRLLVHEDVHDEFVDELADRAAEITLGPPMDDPDMGPLISETQYGTVRRSIDNARETLGDPVVGGDVPDREGYFVEPTIFDDVPNDATIAQEEVFGPVLTVTTFADEAEALALANDTEYGLTAGIFTEDMGRAHRFARDVEAGVVYINEWFAAGVESPFGGTKNSGIGREAGEEAIRGYTQLKAVTGAIDR
ncbi:aldehyde dehydrogenase [Halobacteriales archaeon QH_6_66_25]|nr:MAG: aldehyde dehydrogenase [Halobacteriales archaeon QH_6_66_25]